MLDRKKVLKARAIIGEMLADRGVDIEWSTPETDTDPSTDRTFLESLGGQGTLPDGGVIEVMWAMTLSADTVKTIAADFGLIEGLVHVMVVVESETNPAKEKVATYNRVNPNHKIEVWNWEGCQVNITKHVLVPRHERCAPGELERMCAIHHTSPELLPVLLTTDPVCRWYDFPVGSMIKITRASGEIAYRVVKRP